MKDPVPGWVPLRGMFVGCMFGVWQDSLAAALWMFGVCALVDIHLTDYYNRRDR